METAKETNPRSGTFAFLGFHGGVAPGVPGPWKLDHHGNGLHGYVHLETGDFVEVSAVNVAKR